MVDGPSPHGDLETCGTKKPQQSARDVVRNVALGVGALALGIAGAMIPVLPGWLFGLVGLVLLGSAFPPLRRIISNLIVRSGSFIDRCVASPSANRLLVRTLGFPAIRRSLEPSARWTLLNRAARRATQNTSDESAEERRR